MNYIFVFCTAQDSEDFEVSTKGQKRFKVVSRIDRRTLSVRFRKGTKAERLFNLADVWNADIVGLTC